ncbi:SGNH/GDSL hydrolase family protein [Niveispirillum lacus]|nr:SGNH/GDSL hydrolase family protein [Niveispirillum lacus]
MRLLCLALLSSLLTACAGGQQSLPPGASYVAMGSSFAAGPGLLPYVPGAPARCARSSRNYAQQLAVKRGLALVDVTCSGAATGAVLDGWNELPAQMTAIGTDTRLVTITIGGNDVAYIGNMIAASCQILAAGAGQGMDKCRAPAWPTEDGFQRLDTSLRRVAAEIRSRAPEAIVVFVDYAAILPPIGTCAATPLSAESAERLRDIDRRLRGLTAAAAEASGTFLLKVSDLSRDHGACSTVSWMTGYPAPPGVAPYHPNLAGMTAVAEALDRLLPR